MNYKKKRSIPTLDMLVASQVLQIRINSAEKEKIILHSLHILYFNQFGIEGEKGIGAVCLEFGFFAWGKDMDSAEEGLTGLILVYFQERLKNKEFKEISEDIADNFMEPYWLLYRQDSVPQIAPRDIPLGHTKVLNKLKGYQRKNEYSKQEFARCE